MRKVAQILLLVGLFLCSFVLFLFMTFPYEVLKEQIAAELSQSTGMQVRIGKLGPNLPLGIDAGDVKLTASGGLSSVSFSRLSVGVGVFSFLLGKLHVDVEAASGPGTMDLGLDFGLFDLIGQTFVPRRVTFEAKAFPLDSLVDFGLGMAANAPNANPLLAPFLSALGVSAKLNAQMDFDLDSKNLVQSSGKLDLLLANAILKLSHPSIGLPDQTMKRAALKAKLDAGSLVFDTASGFASDELQLIPEGKVILKSNLGASQLDMKVLFKLDKTLKEKFGFIVDAMSGGAASDGQLTFLVRGSFDNPNVTKF